MHASHASELAQIAQTLATKAQLKHLRDWNFDCLLGCTAVVGVGLFMEAPEIAHDMWGLFRRKSIALKYWLTPSMDRNEYHLPNWMKALSAVGWVVIVLGVGGEGVFEAYVAKYDAALS